MALSRIQGFIEVQKTSNLLGFSIIQQTTVLQLLHTYVYYMDNWFVQQAQNIWPLAEESVHLAAFFTNSPQKNKKMKRNTKRGLAPKEKELHISAHTEIVQSLPVAPLQRDQNNFLGKISLQCSKKCPTKKGLSISGLFISIYLPIGIVQIAFYKEGTMGGSSPNEIRELQGNLFVSRRTTRPFVAIASI